jgi:hypothetical protein
MEVEMKWTRVLLGLMALLMMCFAACDYTVGDCYPVGQGAGAGDVGAGNGAVVSVGASGDQPVGQAEGALSEAQCNEPPDNACPADGCTPRRTCVDMFDKCQDIGGECTKAYPGCDTYGSSACRSCFDACKSGAAYPPKCKCTSCGFD